MQNLHFYMEEYRPKYAQNFRETTVVYKIELVHKVC